MQKMTVLVSAAILAAAVQSSRAADTGAGSAAPAIVSHIKIVSDKVEDISSLDAWKASFIKPDMTEQQKALAVWLTVVKFRQQTSPPNEFLDDDANVHDPIKDFNVYGYGMCCCASAGIEALSRYAGLEARGWGINNHSVPEVKIDGHWGMLDASLINYFQKPDGQIAGVEEINKSITDWLDQHPDYKPFSDHKDYYNIMRKGEWKKIGPDVLKGSSGYDDNGWLPAHTHAWGDSIFEFGGKAVPIKDAHTPFLFEYGSALGYEVNIQLRPGEKLIRNWSNKGLDVNQAESHKPAPILTNNPQDPAGDFRYAPKFGDLAEGRAGNGELVYNPPLDSLQSAAISYENISVTNNTLHAADPAKPATLILRVPSSYVYLDGRLMLQALGNAKISISDNNGLDWRSVERIDDKVLNMSQHSCTYDLKPYIFRRYDYRLKIELTGTDQISAIVLTHDIMQSQRALPILDKGDTKISFSAGAQEGTITVEGNLPRSGSDPKTAKNLLFSDFHPVLDNVQPAGLHVKPGTGTVTVPVTTPGEMTRIRLGAFYRAVTEAEKWTVEASFDDGKTYSPVVTLEGPNRGDSKYVTFDKVPPNTTKALIRFTGIAHAPDNLWMQDLCISADYKEPHGGFAPIKVTYDYEENGQPKTDIHIAKSADETYTIHCDTKPKMKSITLELAQ